MTKVDYRVGDCPDTEAIIDLYNSSGIRRPVGDPERIRNMYVNSNLVVSARDGGILVGIARSLTDFCYACYLSDLAVRKEYQKQGVGMMLIEATKKEIGPQASLILLSATGAMGYYPKIGFEKIENGFIIHRKS
jgi:predicted N-acetyltransferase YhbS